MRTSAWLLGLLLLGTSVLRADDAAPAADGANGEAGDAVVQLVSGKLFRLEHGAQRSVDAADLASIKYFAIYYSAQWCPPCHLFTPDLVKFYNDFKPSHPEFELIFVSEDNDAKAMLDYMKEMAMPWPAVRFSQLKHDGAQAHTFQGSGIERFANHGIPDLVLVDADGKVLADSYHGTEYVGPQKVIDAIKEIVK